MDKDRPEWDRLYAQASAAAIAWRQKESRATLLEIEACVDEQLADLRAKMIADMAMASELAQLKAMEQVDRPRCPNCDRMLQANGQHRRKVHTNHNRAIQLERSQAKCPECGGTFFPSG